MKRSKMIQALFGRLPRLWFLGLLATGLGFVPAKARPPADGSTTLDFSVARYNEAHGINTAGQLAEWYQDSGGEYGFLNLKDLDCDEERDRLIQEYSDYEVDLSPQCEDFTQSARSQYFSFAELNVNNNYAWALLREPLVIEPTSGYGLDKWREEYGGPRITNSVYRSPSHNRHVGGARYSRHMHGDAADLRNRSRTEEEWQAMVEAAQRAQADWIEPRDGPCHIGCVHADWRNTDGGYVMLPVVGQDQKITVSADEVTALLTQLEDSQWQARSEAFYRLLRVTEKKDASAKPYSALSSLLEAFPEKADQIKAALIKLLERENSFRTEHASRYAIAGALLSEPFTNYYADLISVVAKLRDVRSLNTLLSAIDTGNMATRGLAGLGRPALDPIILRLKDKDIIVRNGATIALKQMLLPDNVEKISDPISKAKIKRALVQQTADEDPFVRISAIEGLALLKDPEVIPLIERLAESDPYQASQHGGSENLYPVREAAEKLLHEIGGSRP